MKKNLPYFLVIAALIFLIIGVLSSGKETLQATTSDEESAEQLLLAQESLDVIAAQGEAQKTDVSVPQKIFNLYTDSSAPDNRYAASGWMGDTGDISMNEQYMENPHSGTTCIKVGYSAKGVQGKGWAGVFWQDPVNNWGEIKGGYDLTGYNKLTFWARGETGGEAIEKFKVGGISGAYPDSVEVVMGPVVLGTQWKKYSINLSGEDLSYVSGGFSWVTNSRLNPNGAVFYLDDIRFEYEPDLQLAGKKAEKMPFDIYTERTSVANHFIPSGWMGDTADLEIKDGWTADPYSGTTCIRVVYSAASSRWAGIFWQSPEDNWGQVKDAGFDLSAAKKLTLWARGEKGGERIDEFKMGGISGDYPDSDVAGIGPMMLTPQWQQYSIDLAGKDLSYIIGGFCFSLNAKYNPEGCVFYLDDIRYE